MIKQKKLEQRDREEFLKKTMSNMSMTSGSQREATATKQEGDEASKPQTTIPQSQEVNKFYVSARLTMKCSDHSLRAV